MNNEETNIIPVQEVNTTIEEVANKVLTENNPEEAKKLISLFNWNMSKKNVARIVKLNELYDSVTDHMSTRLATKSDQFTNSDLLDYMKAIQGAIDTSSKNLTQAEEPPVIVQNNTQVNINMNDQFDREAKERILTAIQATLAAAQRQSSQDIIEEPPEIINQKTSNDIIEVTAEEITSETDPSENNVEAAIEELDSILPIEEN